VSDSIKKYEELETVFKTSNEDFRFTVKNFLHMSGTTSDTFLDELLVMQEKLQNSNLKVLIPLTISKLNGSTESDTGN